jgi:alpha-L-fucosidase
MTLNGHWGYFLGDENWKPARIVIHNLVDIISKGGNYLLNVGPTGQGIIPQGAVDDLQQVGGWMKINGESIYGTTASPLKSQPAWGRVTKKGGTLYLHVFDWPKDGKLTVEGLGAIGHHAYLLADAKKENLKIVSVADADSGASFQIQLPAKPIDPIDTVVVLQL